MNVSISPSESLAPPHEQSSDRLAKKYNPIFKIFIILKKNGTGCHIYIIGNSTHTGPAKKSKCQFTKSMMSVSIKQNRLHFNRSLIRVDYHAISAIFLPDISYCTAEILGISNSILPCERTTERACVSDVDFARQDFIIPTSIAV